MKALCWQPTIHLTLHLYQPIVALANSCVVGNSVSLALIGGAAATVLAAVLLHLLSAWRPGASFNFPVEFLVDPDPMVYLFAVLLALFTGMLFGVLPARQVWRTNPNHVLKSGAVGDVVSRRISLRDLLLVVQLA